MGKAKRLNAGAGFVLAAATLMGAATLTSVALGTPEAQADPVSEYNQKTAAQADLKSKLAGVNQDLANEILNLNDLTTNKIPAAQQTADTAQQSADQAKSLAQATSDRLEAAKKDKSDLETQIKKTGSDYDDAKAGVAEQARDGFHGSDASEVMDVVTKSSTTKDFVDKMQSDAAVTRSETNAASDDATTLGKSQNRKQRLSAIEDEIGKLKDQADSQAASAEQAAESASAQAASLQSLRDQSEQSRKDLESRKGELTTQSAQQAAQIAILGSQIDSMNENMQASYTQANAYSGGSQQSTVGSAPAAPAAPAAAPSAPAAPAASSGYVGHPTGDYGNAYPPRQCTLWAYLRRHQLGLPVGSYFGNGGQWANSARALGYNVDRTPSVGAIVVFAPGQSVGGHWTADPSYGHVAIVEGVFGGQISISEGGTGFSTFPAYETIGNIGAYEYIHN